MDFDEVLRISTDVVGFCRIGSDLYGSEWGWLDSNSCRQLLTDLNGYGSMGFVGCEWSSTDLNIMDLYEFQSSDQVISLFFKRMKTYVGTYLTSA